VYLKKPEKGPLLKGVISLKDKVLKGTKTVASSECKNPEKKGRKRLRSSAKLRRVNLSHRNKDERTGGGGKVQRAGQSRTVPEKSGTNRPFLDSSTRISIILIKKRKKREDKEKATGMV